MSRALSNKEIKATSTREDPAELPSLIERLFEQLTRLLDQKLTLLKVEVKEDINAFLRDSIVIAAGAVAALIGFALINVALAFVVSTLFANTNFSQPARYALGFITTGAIYVIAGTVVIIIAKNRLADRGMVPDRTVRELERDKEWIENDL